MIFIFIKLLFVLVVLVVLVLLPCIVNLCVDLKLVIEDVVNVI